MGAAKPSLFKQVFISTSSQAASQVFVSILGIFVLKIMTSSLGLERYGTYATIYAFVSAFALLTDLGLNSITAREVAKSPGDTADIISHNMGLRLFLCVCMIPLIFLASLAVYPHAGHALRLGILLFSFYLFMDAIRAVSLAYFVSQVRNEVTAGIGALQQVVQLSLVIVAAVSHWGVIGFVLIFLGNNVAMGLLAYFLARRHVRIRPKVNLRKWATIFRSSISLGMIQLVNMLYFKADIIILSALAGAGAVGIYNISYSLVLAFTTLPGFMLIALLPKMSVSSSAEIAELIQKALQYLSILACLLVVGAFVVRSDVVYVVSSASYASAAAPFAILALGTGFSYLNSIYGFASVSLNKHHKIIFVSLGALVLNIILNFILIPRFVVAGAAWATAISECVVLVASGLLFRFQTGISVNHARPLIKPLLAATAVFAASLAARPLWSTPSHLLNVAIASLFVAVLYGAALVGLRAVPPEVKLVLKQRLAKLRRA